ncbi:MAG: hypothetical protein GTN99_10200 [Candidatus Dadabacteria bacterium]|nr:hypothetical protein [Candidatus Dadabacteria bacterium]
MSGMGTSTNILNTTGGAGNHLIMRNSKLPASWAGSFTSAAPTSPGTEILINNVDSGDTNYKLYRETIYGTIVDETTIVKDSGASDGTTQLSWKMDGGSNPEWNFFTLITPEIVKWNETTGSSITVTVDFIHDSLTALQDDEIWLEVQYLGTSGFPLSVFVDDAASDYLATPANQTASSSTWTTTGLTNPNEQELSVSFTPQEKGFIHAKVHLAKASYTVYVDPELSIT